MEMTRPELVTIAQTCADWAPNYYRSPVHGGKNAAIRYIAGGHLDGLTLKYGRPAVWRAVAAHLNAHPHLLTAPRTTQAERDNRQAARNARADAHLTAALHHHKAAEPYETLALMTRGTRLTHLQGLRPVPPRRTRQPAAPHTHRPHRRQPAPPRHTPPGPPTPRTAREVPREHLPPLGLPRPPRHRRQLARRHPRTLHRHR